MRTEFHPTTRFVATWVTKKFHHGGTEGTEMRAGCGQNYAQCEAWRAYHAAPPASFVPPW
jgi:hypothetical protein